jgi:hypothetical protein
MKTAPFVKTRCILPACESLRQRRDIRFRFSFISASVSQLSIPSGLERCMEGIAEIDNNDFGRRTQRLSSR